MKLLLLDNGPDSDPEPITSEELIACLEGLPNLTHIVLCSGWEDILDEAVIRHLLLRPNLEMLDIGNDNTPLRWPEIARLETELLKTHILSEIRFLDIVVDKKSAEYILTKLQKLQGLHLVWDGDQANGLENDPSISRCEVLSWLSTCSSLEEVNISGHFDFEIPLQSFLDLAQSCPLLRSLEIENAFFFDDIQSQAPDDFIENMASNLKHLEQLHLPFIYDFSSSSLGSLSRHCPKLTSLHVPVIFDLSIFTKIDNISFPFLQNWHIGYFEAGPVNPIRSMKEAEEAGEELISIIENSCPALRNLEFAFTSSTPFWHDFKRLVDEFFAKNRQFQEATPFRSIRSRLIERLIEPLPDDRYNSEI